MPERLKIALIGVGGYGRKLADAIRQVPSQELYLCYHPDRSKAIEASKVLGCRPAFSREEAVYDENVHAVVIAVPDPYHFSYVRLAMAAAKHVFVEKPMVGCWQELLDLQALMSDYHGVFFVGHNMRREAAFRRIKKEYSEGKLGRLVTFQINLSHGGAFNWGDGYWRTKPEFCREGPMRVNGVHASDVLEYLFEPVDSVYARATRLAAGKRTPDSGIVLAKIGETYGTIGTHWIVPSVNRFHFQFTEAVVDFDLAKLFIRYGRDVDCMATAVHEIPLPAVDVRVEQMEEFSGAILGKNGVETGWHEGMRAVRFFEACWRSHEENREIRLSEL
jgi:predicted dehydrogenase